MFIKFYKPRNVLSLAFHYGATAAVIAGSVMIGQPWVIGTAVCLVGGVSVLSLKSQKHFLENNLVKHPSVHGDSPHLGEIIDDLYKKSGLQAEGNPVYNFLSIENEKESLYKLATKGENRKARLAAAYKEIFNKMAKTHNAAALRLGKPVIMISDPLLKLLDDAEEKAVLAHEFTHAAARHNHAGLPQNILAGVAGAISVLTRLTAFFAVGLTGIFAGMTTRITTGLLFGIFQFRKDDDLSIADLASKKKRDSVRNMMSAGLSTAVYTYFSPAYLGIYAATKALGFAAVFLRTSLSRSNEYQADQGSVILGADPLALITALRKITLIQERAQEKIFEGKVPKTGALTKIWNQLKSSHPTLERRTKRLARLARKQGVAEDRIKQATHGPLNVSADNDLSLDDIKALASSM